MRYQLSRDVSVGGGATVREFDGRGWQTYGYVQSQNRLGIGRAQLDFTEATTGERSQSLAVDQTFRELDGLRLSTSLSLSRQTAPVFKRNTVSLSVAGGLELFNNFILDANIQGRTTLSGPRDNALFTTIGVAWQFARYWSLNASAIFGTGRFDSGVTLDPLTPPTLVTTRPNQRSFLVTLRYEDRAGSIAAPLGGRAGSGGAPVSGVVFLDANNNGVADASEAGVANLTVLLDGRFSARTDAQGRFEFGFVGAGPHSLTVVTDNLPLPWTVNNDGLTRITVSPREAQRVSIPAVKMP
jgi:SdrD B-like domain